jgi:AraC family transcriptional regulator
VSQIIDERAPPVSRIGLVYLRPRRVAFVRAYGPYSNASQQAWDVLLAWLDRQNLKSHLSCGFGLAYDNPRRTTDDGCRYDACVELPDHYAELMSDGLAFQMLPGGAFARARHVGPHDTVKDSVTRIRDTWLPDQPHLVVDRTRPFLFCYLDDPRSCAHDDLRSDVCLPVKTPAEEGTRAHRSTDPMVA